MNQLRTKLMPHSPEAEASILGAILQNEKLIFKVIPVLDLEDFFSKRHGLIFKTMCEMATLEKPIDTLTLAEHLREKGISEDCGGIDYLTELEKYVPTGEATTHHCEIVRGKALMRKLIQVGEKMLDAAWADEGEPGLIVDSVQSQIFNLAVSMTSKARMKHVYQPGEWVELAVKATADWLENPSAIRGVETGMRNLDMTLRGLKDVNIISASTGVGKTALGINWAINIGIRQKIPCLYLNYEMNLEELALRVQAILSDIPTSQIFSGQYNEPNAWSKMTQSFETIRQGKLFLTGNEPKNINTSISLIHQHKIQHDIKVVFVDYLGEIEPDAIAEKENSEYRTFGRWVGMLKSICTSLGVKLVLLAQMNREGEDDPKLSRVGGSWKIAQKADVFIIIKPEKHNHVLWIAKNRNGKEKFGINIDFDKPTQRITEVWGRE